ncbi:PWWP domain-containing protein 2B [Myotis brandtii]|uniref:PWWP domain-containing protein 2B n=1 Tax=Myotis brandtii TaxID=109478 RepID=S7NFL4_MYOBR|nr:PWWP domain-containing protein 2B [Myotis brandtii]
MPPSADLPPPKIRLKPHRLGAGEQEPVYRAELVEELNGRGQGAQASSPAHPASGSAHGALADLSSGSSGEDDDFKTCPQGKHGRDSLAFLASCSGSRTDYARESLWSSDSLDESKSSSSEVTSPDTCDLSSGDGVSVPPTSKRAGQTVPPLTVRLHTQSISKCVTEDGRTVAVGDIVWDAQWPLFTRSQMQLLAILESGSPQGREATRRSGEGDAPSHLCCCHCRQRKPRAALVTCASGRPGQLEG